MDLISPQLEKPNAGQTLLVAILRPVPGDSLCTCYIIKGETGAGDKNMPCVQQHQPPIAAYTATCHACILKTARRLQIEGPRCDPQRTCLRN